MGERFLSMTLDNSSKDFAIVTGAGSGIGRALAIELSEEPVIVLAVGRREEPLLETVDLASGQVKVISADIGRKTGRTKVLGTLIEGSRVKYLVHAAGVCTIERATDITPESWQNVMATNVDGRLFLTLCLLPWLQRGSRVLFVGSNSATKPRKGSTAYCVSKAASFMLHECLKLELSKDGVYVTSAIPSPVNTPMVADQMRADAEIYPDGVDYRRLRDDNRLISPAAVAKFYRWLLTEIAGEEYSGKQWNIQDTSHHRHWLDEDELFE